MDILKAVTDIKKAWDNYILYQQVTQRKKHCATLSIFSKQKLLTLFSLFV